MKSLLNILGQAGSGKAANRKQLLNSSVKKRAAVAQENPYFSGVAGRFSTTGLKKVGKKMAAPYDFSSNTSLKEGSSALADQTLEDEGSAHKRSQSAEQEDSNSRTRNNPSQPLGRNTGMLNS